MNKERFKGLVMGFVLCAALSTSVIVAANSSTVTRQITYGVNVVVNGVITTYN